MSTCCYGLMHHRDAQAFVAKELPETSLPPSSGCAVDASHDRRPKAVSKGTRKQRHSCEKRLCVVVDVVE